MQLEPMTVEPNRPASPASAAPGADAGFADALMRAAAAPAPTQLNSAAPIITPKTDTPVSQAAPPTQLNSAAQPEAKPAVPAADA